MAEKGLATRVGQLIAPLRAGGEILPGVGYVGARFDDGVALDFALGRGGDFAVRMEPVDRPGEGYLQTKRLRLTYRGATPLPAEAHRTLKALGALIGHNESRFRRVEFSEMAAGLRTGQAAVVHGRVGEVRVIIRCNEACPFCHTDERAENVAFDLDVYRGYLETFRERGVQTLILTGGEPTLRDDLEQFVALGKEMGFTEVGLQSNAVRLGIRDRARSLKKAGLDKVFISLHSDDAAVLKEMTKFAKALEGTIAGIRACQAAGLPVTLNHVLTSVNLSGVARFPDFVAETFGTDLAGIVFSIASPNFHGAASSSLLLNPADVAAPLSAALRRCAQLGLPAHVPSLCGTPACVLEDDVRPFHRDLVEEVPKYHGKHDRVYGPGCDGCAVRPRCTGAWAMTVQRFGTGWMAPVTDFPSPLWGEG